MSFARYSISLGALNKQKNGRVGKKDGPISAGLTIAREKPEVACVPGRHYYHSFSDITQESGKL